MTLLITFILAFCSISYELQLGQTLSAFLGNTVLRFSVTIGLYMAAMGLGALCVRGKYATKPLYRLQLVEISLSAIGALALPLLFSLDALHMRGWPFSIVAHLLIIVIGLLSGAEIPLLFSIRNQEQADVERSVLGVDYLGAFVGTILFAFVFYPKLGLFLSIFSIAALNSLIGLFLVYYRLGPSSSELHFSRPVFTWQLLIGISTGIALIYHQAIANYFTTLYLQGGSL